VRVRPYRTTDDRIDGVVMTFMKWASTVDGRPDTS